MAIPQFLWRAWMLGEEKLLPAVAFVCSQTNLHLNLGGLMDLLHIFKSHSDYAHSWPADFEQTLVLRLFLRLPYRWVFLSRPGKNHKQQEGQHESQNTDKTRATDLCRSHRIPPKNSVNTNDGIAWLSHLPALAISHHFHLFWEAAEEKDNTTSYHAD